jgi:hypothetical protein
LAATASIAAADPDPNRSIRGHRWGDRRRHGLRISVADPAVASACITEFALAEHGGGGRPVVYGRFLPAVGAALAVKRAVARDIAVGDLGRLAHDDRDAVICIQPVNSAIQRDLGRFAGPPFLSYPSASHRDC